MPHDRDAIFRLEDADGRQLGTAFLASCRLAITSHHCLPDSVIGGDEGYRLRLSRASSRYDVRYKLGDPDADFAILEVTSPETPLPCLPLSHSARFDAPVRVIGWPSHRHSDDAVTVSGHVADVNSTIFDGHPAIQIFSNEAAGGVDLHGMSGSPVIAEPHPGKPRVIGVLRWSPPDAVDRNLSAGGMAYACPSSAVLAGDTSILEELLEHDCGVYVAHAEIDVEIAKKLVALLISEGLNAAARFTICPYGENFGKLLESALEDHPVMFLLHTDRTQAFSDSMFAAELEQARRTSAPVIPVYTHLQPLRAEWSERRPLSLYSIPSAVERAKVFVSVAREAIVRNALGPQTNGAPLKDILLPSPPPLLPEMDFRIEIPGEGDVA